MESWCQGLNAVLVIGSGDVVLEGENYNNGMIAFTGMSKTGNDLPPRVPISTKLSFPAACLPAPDFCR